MERVSFTVRLGADYLARLDRLAEAQLRTRSNLIELALLEYIKRAEAKRKQDAPRG